MTLFEDEIIHRADIEAVFFNTILADTLIEQEMGISRMNAVTDTVKSLI
jgi:hypothetical protein